MKYLDLKIPDTKDKTQPAIAQRKKALLKIFQYQGGNIEKAIKIVGISRTTYTRYIDRDPSFKLKAEIARNSFFDLAVSGLYAALKDKKNPSHYKACERMLDAYKYRKHELYKMSHVNSDNKNTDTVKMKVTGIKINWTQSNENQPEKKKEKK